MLKVFMKGFTKPYAVFGNFLFEDERFFVIENQGIQSKIPHENILYIESFIAQPVEVVESYQPEPSIPPSQPAPPISSALKNAVDRAMAQSAGALDAEQTEVADDEMVSANVMFTGFKEQSFSVPLQKHLLVGKFVPQLSKAIFANPQIKAFSGDFILSGTPTVDGENITIPTVALSGKTDALKEKLDTTSQFLNKMMSMSQPKQPSMGFDAGFSMPGSPFSTTISLQDSDDL